MTRPPLRSLATRAALAIQHRLDLLGVDHGHDQRIGGRGGLAGVAAIVPPAAAKASRAGALGSTPITLWPCLSRFFAMPRPIEPRPTKATTGVFLSAMDHALMPYFAAQPRPAPVVVLGLYSRPT